MSARTSADETREALTQTGGRQAESVVLQEGHDYQRAEEAIAEWQSLPWWRRLWEWIRP